jgi:hypothetical protein
MYRSPEMLDLYMNYPICESLDIWVSGIVMDVFFCLMSSKHYYSYIIVLFLVHEVVSIIIAILVFYSWYMKL